MIRSVSSSAAATYAARPLYAACHLGHCLTHGESEAPLASPQCPGGGSGPSAAVLESPGVTSSAETLAQWVWKSAELGDAGQPGTCTGRLTPPVKCILVGPLRK